MIWNSHHLMLYCETENRVLWKEYSEKAAEDVYPQKIFAHQLITIDDSTSIL